MYFQRGAENKMPTHNLEIQMEKISMPPSLILLGCSPLPHMKQLGFDLAIFHLQPLLCLTPGLFYRKLPFLVACRIIWAREVWEIVFYVKTCT